MRPTKLFLIVFIALTFSNTQAQTSFSNWDKDNDNLLEKEEFTKKFQDEYFSTWGYGTNTRGIIDEDFLKESFAGLDTDNDNYLYDQEWLIGYNYFYEDYFVKEDLGKIDANEDGKLEYEEYYDVIYNTSYFSDVDLDSDNYISEYELAEYVFNNWDIDDNGLISRYEFDAFKSYYLDV